MKTGTQTAEEQLLIEAAQRDRRVFGELYDRNFDRLYCYVSRRTRTREQAEDIAAEVFHRALNKLGDYEWRGVPFIAWLYRIAANLLADRSSQENITADAGETADEGSAQSIEQGVLMAELLGTLPPEQRRVIEMRFAEQKTVREIARELQRSEGAIKQLQFRAISKLREAVAGESSNG